MIWEAPNWLFALWVLPVLAWLLWRTTRKRREAALRFADAWMAPRITPAPEAGRSLLRACLLLTGIACLIVAAARPRFGLYFEQISRRGVDLFVCLDVSRSMLANDVAPNRLERAKSDILDLLQRLEGDRVGLIAFAGKPAVICPLTSDQAFFRSSLASTNPNSAPRGGSLIGDAIRRALVAMPQRFDRDQSLLLITDGEDHDSLPLDAAAQAAERGVRVFTVGIGDTGDGARIPIDGAMGTTEFLQHEGQIVWSKLDEQLLKDIALRTEGAYVPAGTSAYDLGEIYDQHLAELTSGEFETEKRKRYKERFQWFLLAGLVLLALEMLVPEYSRRTARGRFALATHGE